MRRKTALVTGASDGIGLAFSRSLARRDYDLVLVARREQQLNEAARLLSDQYGVSCTVIARDLSKPNAAQEVFHSVKQQGLSVDFLVNNAGLLCNGFFTELELLRQEDMIMVNVLALTSLAHLFATDMAVRGGGHILNVSSLAAWMAIPNQNVYAATKAYVLSFSQALADEMAASGSGVIISALCPGYTSTKMLNNPEQGSKLKVSKAMTLPADVVAEQGVKSCLQQKTTIMPGMFNKVVAAFSHLFPKMTMARLMGKNYRKNMS